jgi:tRNA(Ile)-lysidine synthetase-like protein
MKIDVPAGRYVVAVSGGVDSVALLHMLARLQSHSVIPSLGSEAGAGSVEESAQKLRTDPSPAAQDDGKGKYRFVVAHFDHGIREDSAEDRRLVQALAREYGLPFVYREGQLGPDASEAAAREARYAFLHHMREVSGASAVITAHHQDDVLETIVLNLLRGTGRRGLSSLKSTDVVKRPLLHVPKKELLRYASREGLRWRDDSTNADEKYARNYVRKYILPRFADRDREALYILGRWAHKQNHEISEQVSNYLHLQPGRTMLDRHSFVMLPHLVAREVMAEWLLANTGAELSRKLLERLVVAAKTGKAGTQVDIDKGHWLKVSRTTLALKARER